MDYRNATGNLAIKDDRDNTSGARVFDGEDQGNVDGFELNFCRLWEQGAHAVDADGGLD